MSIIYELITCDSIATSVSFATETQTNHYQCNNDYSTTYN